MSASFAVPANLHSDKPNGNEEQDSFAIKAGLAQMLKGGVIMDVINAEQARIAEEAGACAVMALERQLGCDGVFVGSGIFKSGDPAKRAKAIVQAVTHYNDPKVLAEISEDLGEAMVGINLDSLPENEKYAKRGW
ncbi:Putative Pyridoxine biosynthesis protein pyroA [Rhizopus microsporus]|nr:Putative Pyridoxine biosynthesis protein pyroA [Rhizopus microsporus]